MALWSRSTTKKTEVRARQLWERGFQYFENELFSSAVRDLSQAIALEPAYQREAHERMSSFLAQGSVAHALSLGMALLKHFDEDPQLLNQVGNILRLQGSFKRAERFYMRALELKPKLKVARYNLAANRFKIRTADEALIKQTRHAERFRRPRRHDFCPPRRGVFPLGNPDQPDESADSSSPRKKERHADRNSQANRLLSILAQELSRDPESWEKHYNLALMLDLSGQGVPAIGHYRQALKLHNRHPAIGNNLAVVYLDTLNAPKHAETILQKNLKRYPFDRTTVLNLAVLHHRRHARSYQALLYYVYLGDLLRRSLGAFDTRRLQREAEQRFHQRQFEASLALYEDLLIEEPQQTRWLERLATIYAALHDDLPRMRTLKKLLSRSPNHPEARMQLLNMAKDYQKQAFEAHEAGKLKEAVEALRNALTAVETPERWQTLIEWHEANENHDEANEARQRMAELVLLPPSRSADPA